MGDPVGVEKVAAVLALIPIEKLYELYGKCGALRREGKCVQGFGGKPRRKEAVWKTVIIGRTLK
jgi:hypothetical protein